MIFSINAINRMKILGKKRILIKIYKGGCAGYLYEFAFTPEESMNISKVYTNEDIEAVFYGENIELGEFIIDYKSSLMENRFILRKTESCKCGISLKIRSK